MDDGALSRPEFLALSTRLCDDLRRWLIEAAQYHTLDADELEALTRAAEIIDRETVALASAKPE